MQQQNQALETYVLLFVLVGIVVGFISRLWMIKSDARQYPTLPNGYLIHITTAFIAASMSAVAYPALRTKNYIAVTFLAIDKKEQEEIASELSKVLRGNIYRIVNGVIIITN